MKTKRILWRRVWHVIGVLLVAFGVAACTPPQSASPRPTAPTIIEITPAPTQDVDATATAYAELLIPTPTPAGLYVVQSGDTLSSLAEEFGTTVEELLAANGLTNPDALQVGQSLLIPSLISTTLLLETATVTATAAITGTAVISDATPTPTFTTP